MLVSTLLALTSLGLVQAADTVKSKDGTVEYNCPTVQTIENFYVDACPSSIGGTTQLVHTDSRVAYYQAPTDYTVGNGEFNLYCQYNDIYDNIIECSYIGGTGGLTLEDGYHNDQNCLHDLNTGPQPSKRAVSNGNAGVYKREDLGPFPFQCPHDSSRIDTFVQQASAVTAQSNGGIYYNSYSCRVQTPDTAEEAGIYCNYEPYGNLLENYDGQCPAKLCRVPRSSNRVRRRGVRVGDSPIHARQVNTTLLRESGRKRVQE